MNRITKEQYETAKRNVVRLGAAQETVKTWEERMKTIPAEVRSDVTEIADDGYKVGPRKENRREDAAA